MKKSPVILLALSLFLLLANASAQAQALPEADPGVTLKPGDPAPALKVGAWLRGEPVKGFEKGKIYVVECWASWCGPCRQMIPHMTKMQEDFKDKVTMIGVDVSEENPSDGVQFVKDQGDKMGYRVAQDDTDASVSKAWLQAAGQNGIPCSFVVDKDSKIAWIGHPAHLDKILPQVVAGTFNPKTYQKITELNQAIGEAVQAKDWTKAMNGLSEWADLDPSMANQIASGKFMILFAAKKDTVEAYALAKKLLDGQLKDDPQALNEIAWTILDAPDVDHRDFELAIKLASRASDLSKGNDTNILDTLARAWFDSGNVSKAIETQTQAVEKSKNDAKVDAQTRTDMQARLDKYKAALPKPAAKT